MSRSRFPRPSVRVPVEEGRPLRLADLRRAGVYVDGLIAATGITPRHLEAYVSGEKTPTLWLQRVIAQAVGVEPQELWPARGSDEHRGSFENLGRGVSRAPVTRTKGAKT